MQILNKITLSVSLKVLAIILWLFTPLFLITILYLNNLINLPGWLIPDIRGEYKWDFELMFAVIYFVWGIFLWKAAKYPVKHLLFIDFTIWANLIHGLTMILIGIINKDEFFHLLNDGGLLIILASLIYFKRRNF